MAKTLSFTDMSPQTVKIGDTTTSFSLICGNDNVATDLTKATSITVKLGNNSGYLKSATVDPASLTDPTTGQVTVTFNADLMTSLPAGSYAIEVWVVDPTGTSIYPSDGSTGFTITNNIQSANGSVITTITFDDFVKELNKAASTIAKGDKGDDGLSAYQIAVINGYHGSQTDWLASLKGDTGTVDNAGLTSAPAFQSLQTQVDNSAVGTNLLKNTGNLSSTSTTASWNTLFDSSQVYDSRIKSLSGVSAMTFSFDVYVPSNVEVGSTIPIQIKGQNSQATDIGSDDWNTLIGLGDYVINQNDLGKTIHSSCSVQKDWKYQSFDTAIADTVSINIRQSTGISGFVYSNIKLEKGSVATDWCPNPSEILTQGDYAKIKAAIVALGGSLS